MSNEPDLTGLLQAWSQGDAAALSELAPLVQQELRAMARRMLANERPDGRWQPTELVQESYLRLLDWRTVRWQNRAHFFATAARMMRRVLVDAARARRAVKRNSGLAMVPLDGCEVAAPNEQVDLVAVEEALEALAAVYPRASHVIELRFFGGFSVQETAEALGISVPDGDQRLERRSGLALPRALRPAIIRGPPTGNPASCTLNGGIRYRSGSTPG